MAIKQSPYLAPLNIFLGATFEYEFEIRLNNTPVPASNISNIIFEGSSKYTHEAGANALFTATQADGDITVTESGGDTTARIELTAAFTEAITYADTNSGRGVFEIFVLFTDGTKRLYSYGELHFKGNVVGA